ncbi:hypothetical protein LSTR_LSTR003627 [Laodelphax striatellus]|uniref:Uncharacterized protein n=1 Tax=Laodelphax striatellus TaxID=195883 RepID=A0A482XC96_LAOST|nr:hypothetical protein LSTR_LSTR003627 [Laodelphax striatellus]
MRIISLFIVILLTILSICQIESLPCKSKNRISRYVQISYEDDPLSGSCEREVDEEEGFLPLALGNYPEMDLFVHGLEGEGGSIRQRRDIGQEPRARRVKRERELNWESY